MPLKITDSREIEGTGNGTTAGIIREFLDGMEDSANLRIMAYEALPVEPGGVRTWKLSVSKDSTPVSNQLDR